MKNEELVINYMIFFPGIISIFSLPREIHIFIKIFLILYLILKNFKVNVKKSKIIIQLLIVIIFLLDIILYPETNNKIFYYYIYFVIQGAIPFFMSGLVTDLDFFYRKCIKYSWYLIYVFLLSVFLKQINSNYMELGIGLTLPLLFVINSIFTEKEKIKNYKKLLFFIVLIIFILKVNRSSSLTIILYLLYNISKDFKRIFLLGSLITILIINLEKVLYLINISLIKYNIHSYFFIKLIRMLNSGLQSSSSGRDILYEEACRLINKRPFVGNGIGGFLRGSEYEYPHNIFLQIIIEFGVLVGIFIILFVCFSIFFKMKNNKSTTNVSIIKLLLFNQIRLLFSSTYWVYPSFWFLCGYLLNNNKTDEKNIVKKVK